jgi:thiamine pyrophosphate-dependent acetolactate synthase large subunit-like protein
MAMTPPMEPVMIVADGMLQEHAIEDEKALSIPKLALSAPPQGESNAVREAAKLLAAAQNPVIVAERVTRSQEGIKLMVELAEALNAPVVNLLGRMNFPTTHYLSRTNDGRSLVRDADVVLFLEVGDPWGQLNSVSDPHHQYRRIAKPDVKLIHITLADQLMKSNYQDMQRFCPVDISISADVQATLPSLIESIKRQTANSRAGRSEALRKQYQQMKARIRESATLGWDASPISTARLHAELWQVLKNEDWCLAESRFGSWAARLWPATQQHNFLGQSGGAGVGYIAPAAVGAALANKGKGIITAVVQPDGDLMYAPGVLWTAAHHRIPLLSVMHNNRAYHQEVMHLQKMAGLHNRRMDTARIGTTIEDPNIDYAKLAQAQGVWAEGPITDPAKIGPGGGRARDRRGEERRAGAGRHRHAGALKDEKDSLARHPLRQLPARAGRAIRERAEWLQGVPQVPVLHLPRHRRAGRGPRRRPEARAESLSLGGIRIAGAYAAPGHAALPQAAPAGPGPGGHLRLCARDQGITAGELHPAPESGLAPRVSCRNTCACSGGTSRSGRALPCRTCA